MKSYIICRMNFLNPILSKDDYNLNSNLYFFKNICLHFKRFVDYQPVLRYKLYILQETTPIFKLHERRENHRACRLLQSLHRIGVTVKILLRLYRTLSHMLKNLTEVENNNSFSSVYTTSRGVEVHFQSGEHKVVQAT